MNVVFLPKTYERPISSNFGTKGFEPIFVYRRSKDTGKQELVLKELRDFYAEIQTYKDDTNIYNILDKVLQGDVSSLDKNRSFYQDITGFPTTISDYYAMEDELREKFDGLPIEDKDIFDKDFNVFVKTIKDGILDEKVSEYRRKRDSISRANTKVNNVDNTGSNSKDNGGVKDE